MADLRIRPMTQEDVGEVLVIERAAFSFPWTEDSFRKYLDRPEAIFLVAEEDGQIAGYGAVLVAADQGDIANIAVRPEYRRRGIGEQLVRALIESAGERDVNTLFLEVRESNTAARALYGRIGFSPVGRRKKYYHEPVEDALIMRLCMEKEEEEGRCESP